MTLEIESKLKSRFPGLQVVVGYVDAVKVGSDSTEISHLKRKRLIEGSETIALLRTIVERNQTGLIVDVGCGRGDHRQLLEEFGDVIGIDIRKPPETSSAPYGLLCDICAAPFKSGVFDVVYCSKSLAFSLT